MAREAGIRYPVALTRAAWERCVAVPLGDAFLPDPPGHRLDRLRRHRHVCQLLYQVAGPGAGAGQLIQNAFNSRGQDEAYTTASPEYEMLLAIGWDPFAAVVTTPEPGTLALLGSSLLGFAAFRRHRRR